MTGMRVDKDRNFLERLAARRRFGMKPGLATMRALLDALGKPDRAFRALHVAGTNGKGAVCALLDAAFVAAGIGPTGRYTSPHLVRLNERFFREGRPVDDATLGELSARVSAVAEAPVFAELTFFEALTAVAFLLFARDRVALPVLETGLGGRLDATNVCTSALAVITRIGLDHCDWLGDTLEMIAAEKAGIIKPGVPVVLGKNVSAVRDVIRARALEVGAPFFEADELAREEDLPEDFALAGSFNRENGVTALAALRLLETLPEGRALKGRPWIRGFGRVVWPGRFQRVGAFWIDGAHNPPAAAALAAALADVGTKPRALDLVAGFCGDKDVGTVLATLAPYVRRAYAVKTQNTRSLSAEETSAKMRAAGLDASPCVSLGEALWRVRAEESPADRAPRGLVCGSLFLAGEALAALGAYPWSDALAVGDSAHLDPAERLR